MKDRVSLSKGEIVFGKWKNREQKSAYYAALSNPELGAISDESSKDKIVNSRLSMELLVYSVQNGTGYIKGVDINETRRNIDDLDFEEAGILTSAFEEFATEKIEAIKKK